MAAFKQLSEDFWVAPQLEATDFARAKALGIRTVINNRPDGEALDQLSDDDAAAAASAAGLAYAHVPVVSGAMTVADIEAFREVVDRHEGPFLAYCRSGTRSCFLWAFSAVRALPVSYIVAAAAEAGYDLGPAQPALQQARTAAER
jgi:uncharacterized protein (TIGR01244 family)